MVFSLLLFSSSLLHLTYHQDSQVLMISRQSQIARKLNNKILFVKGSVTLPPATLILPTKLQEIPVELHYS